MIKKLIAIAVVASAGLLAAPKAEAGHSSRSTYTYRSGFSSCGCPIYTTRYIRGYDCYRRPIYGYRQQPLSHGHSCRHRAGRHHDRHDHNAHRGHSGHGYRHSSRVYGPRVTISRGGISFGVGGRSHSGGYSRSRGCR